MDSNHEENPEENPNQPITCHVDQRKKEISLSIFPSFELLNKYGSDLQLLREKSHEADTVSRAGSKPSTSCSEMVADNKPSGSFSDSQVPSTREIMWLAKEKLLRSRAQSSNLLTILACPFDVDSTDSSQVSQDVELALMLQASAEMIATGNNDRARKILHLCDLSSSPNGNPVQRVVYYFSRALKDRTDRVGGITTEMETLHVDQALEELLVPAVLEVQQELPFNQITRFAGVQTITEALSSAKKIHLVDFGIKNGSQRIILMQALADRKDCPVELLKITAVAKSKDMIDQTGKWLSSFAEEMRLNLSYEAIESDVMDQRKEHFELDPDETLAIYIDKRLWTLLGRPTDLETFIGVVIKEYLNPCIMVVIEVEASTNASTFIDRFYEALMTCAAIFDSLGTCVGDKHEYREIAEGLIMREIIQNILTEEGEKRTCRYERINFWRALFAKFGLDERKMSESSVSQARLLIKESATWRPCTLDFDGECLILGWKGTPIRSLSAWGFLHP